MQVLLLTNRAHHLSELYGLGLLTADTAESVDLAQGMLPFVQPSCFSRTKGRFKVATTERDVLGKMLVERESSENVTFGFCTLVTVVERKRALETDQTDRTLPWANSSLWTSAALR